MAIVKIKTAKRNIKGIIDYVTNPDKTNELLISGKDCVPETVVDEMEVVKQQFNKIDGTTYFHVIQSFSPDDNIKSNTAHEIGIKFANYFRNYQVLITTHIDKDHIHNHLIINSVSFENGKKVHMSNKDLERLKEYSNQLCREFNLTETPIKKGIVKDISQNEIAVAERGESWKFKLINDIDECKAVSNSKEEYIQNMRNKGYEVIWTDTRKYITYITPNGNRCRDRSLHDERYLKEEMENEFNGRFKTEKSNNYANTSANANTNEGRIYNNKSRFMGNNSNLYSEYSGQNKKYGIQNGQSTFNGFNNSKYGEGFKGYSTNTNNRTDEEISRRIKSTSENKMEPNYEGSSNRNDNRYNTRYTCNTPFETLITLSYLFETRKSNEERPKRTIRSFRSLSKQAKKEWLYKHRNASSFNWDDEYEM